MTYFKKISELLKDFKRSEDGMVAVLVAVLMVLLLIFAGMAIDFGRAYNTRRAVNQALDTAVLAAARSLATTQLSKQEVEKIISTYFKENIKRSLGSDVEYTVPNVDYDSDGDTVSASASATVPTYFIRHIPLITKNSEDGVDSLSVSASATARFPISDVEIAVVVDTTGSMGNDIEALKTASEDLLDVLLPVANNAQKSRIRVSYVPYSYGVRLGFKDGENLAKKATFNRSTDQCVHWRIGSQMLTDRSHDYEDERERVDYIGSDVNQCSSAQLIPLTSNRDVLLGSINNLSADGWTAGQIGIAWGWYTLSPSWRNFWPTESAPNDYGQQGVRKFAILMTDGDFNQVYVPHSTGYADYMYRQKMRYNNYKHHIDPMEGGKLKRRDHEQIASTLSWREYQDSLESGMPFQTAVNLCQQMRNEGIVIYSVMYGSSSLGQKVMKSCATSEKNTYYEANNKADLIAAFTRIANEIKQIYLSE